MSAANRRVYLDHNASAPILPEAREALVAALEVSGNPSSVHAEGRRARAIVEAARAEVGRLVGAPAANVVFTSGASEAAATCLAPVWIEDGRALEISRLAVVETDHPCILEGGRFDPLAVTRLRVDAWGALRPDALSAWLDGLEGRRGMLALTLANSETGVLQSLNAIVGAVREANVVLVVDAVQAAGRLPLDVAALGADAVILSGHKIGAAKGVGAYALRSESFYPAPLVTGGGQERRHRSGTEAVALIASFGAAARVAAERASSGAASLMSLRERMEAGLHAALPEAVIFGDRTPRLPNTVAFAVPGLKAETAQIALDLAGFAVSSGSACSSGKVGPSHVLRALAEAGLAVDAESGALRVSFGTETTMGEIERFVAAVAAIAGRRKAQANLRAA